MEDEVANVSLCQTNPFDEDFLRDILQQPEAEAYAIGSSIFGHNHTHTNPSPTTYILSFDKSTALLPNDANNNWTHQLPKQSRANQGTKKTRTASESLDHIMSERNRRQELTRKFIALASTIPGLKKTYGKLKKGNKISAVYRVHIE
ncbi:hypothetical protein VNO78_14555 [Psophocarpus tetragonolobus]|uniref:Uncharacterized protein n=1 Tax=Psophocarpus tetragonolobus TaxID=3891 RepID=A0AAN9XQF8_PSOTE